jgi:hypothetical protein
MAPGEFTENESISSLCVEIRANAIFTAFSSSSAEHSSRTFHPRAFASRHSAIRFFLEHDIGMAIAFLSA